MKNADIVIIERGDKNYPVPLSEISVPPEQVYCRGKLELLEAGRPCIAVVGTRKNSQYGVQVTEKIVQELVSYGVIIVSGFAFGIDIIAHRAALKNGGATIAVLPGGVDENSIYPRSHWRAARELLENGLFVSECASGSRIFQSSFLARNRIIAGLCSATLVVECGVRSGALMTARYARDENRSVYAVPGSIFNPASIGPNALIQRGAYPVSSAVDILKDLNIFDGLRAKSAIEKAETVQNFTAAEKVVLQYISSGYLQTEEIIKLSATRQLSKAEILTALSLLELKGIVTEIRPGEYNIIK